MNLLKISGLTAIVSLALLVPTQANAAAPVSNTAPVASGTAEVGQVVSTTDGTWNGTVDSLSYRWLRCPSADAPLPPPSPPVPATSCAVITISSSPVSTSTYTLRSPDAGFFIRSLVTATNVDGSNAAASNNIGPVKTVDLTPASTFSLEPISGSLFTNAFKAADWRVTTGATAPNPPNTELLPTRSTTLRMPGASQMTFNPGTMPVCPDDQIGPTTNNSAPIPTIVAKCPNSILGNGTATFLLARSNNPNTTPPSLNGQVVVFNGGLNGGQPRLKFWAYSYDTGVAIYTESTLTPEGVLEIPIPQLTQDSAVNSLNVNIPGETIEQFLPQQGITITIPGGQNPNYVQAKCDTGVFPYSADFLLGRRLTDGTPIGVPELYTDVGEDDTCTGIPAVARLGKPTVTGPSKVKRGASATYSVRIPNTGGATANGVKLLISGKGVRLSATVPSIPGESSRTVKVKAKFRTAGKVKATFKASSSNGGSATATKTVTVK